MYKVYLNKFIIEDQCERNDLIIDADKYTIASQYSTGGDELPVYTFTKKSKFIAQINITDVIAIFKLGPENE